MHQYSKRYKQGVVNKTLWNSPTSPPPDCGIPTHVVLFIQTIYFLSALQTSLQDIQNELISRKFHYKGNERPAPSLNHTGHHRVQQKHGKKQHKHRMRFDCSLQFKSSTSSVFSNQESGIWLAHPVFWYKVQLTISLKTGQVKVRYFIWHSY